MSYQQSATMTEGVYNSRTSSGLYGQPGAQARPHRDSEGHGVQGSQVDSMASLINSFSQQHLSVPGAAIPGAGQLPVTSQYCYMQTQDGQLVYVPTAGMYSAPMAPAQLPDGSYGAYSPAMFAPQATYSGYVPGYSMMPYATPGRNGYYGDRSVSEVMTKEVPGLDNRRGSYSTTNESAPGTPYYGSLNQRDHGAHIATVDRSPIYSTPSPQTISLSVPQVLKPLTYKASSIHIDLDGLVQQLPAIPHAVPAVFTPRENMRTLEQSLSNPIFGNRNVYIRGLHPNTDDETLAAYAARFGKVETSKAIIDTSTGACKGFGFAKYHDAHDSELCIRGFYKLGYEVGFARESFNARLKANGDENSTNLYVSNLPRNMTESELGAIFMDYTVSSSRILRTQQGQSRGVGFARFESREICEEIIKKFHGQPIGEEGLLLQVRYADTPAQKDLKRITTERRQFRTNEYNVGAYGASPEMITISPPILSPVVPRMPSLTRQMPPSRTNGSWKRDMSGFSNGAAVSSFGTILKDVEKQTVKFAQHPEIMNMQTTATTPTVSEYGSEDEGATVHGISPVVTRGSSSSSPVIQK